jgi:surface polysaccharide O-acyltransferase-like enzyme
MKPAPNPKSKVYNIFGRGIYTVTESSLATKHLKPKKELKKWVYITARVLILIIAVASILGSLLFAMEGSWDIATICFILGLFFFIPFILYGRKIVEMNNAKSHGSKSPEDIQNSGIHKAIKQT